MLQSGEGGETLPDPVTDADGSEYDRDLFSPVRHGGKRTHEEKHAAAMDVDELERKGPSTQASASKTVPSKPDYAGPINDTKRRAMFVSTTTPNLLSPTSHGRQTVIKGIAVLTCLVGLVGLLTVTTLDDGNEIYSDWEQLMELFSVLFLIGLAMLFFTLNPFKCAVGVALWIGWFVYAFLREGQTVIEEVTKRFHSATESTRNFVRQGGLMFSAWGRFLAPFLADVIGFANDVWNSISWRQRIISIFVVMVSYIVYRTYQAVRKRADAIMFTLFQGSYLFVGPAIWYLTTMIPAQHSDAFCTLWTTVAPTIFSLHAYRSVGVTHKAWQKWKSCELWISYWSCWPMICVLQAAAVDYTQKPANQSQALALLVALCIWLQFWFTSKLFFSVVYYAAFQVLPSFDWVLGVLPGVKKVYSLTRSGLNFSQQVSLMELVGKLWENKFFFIPFSLLVVAMIFMVGLRIYSMITNILANIIWWGIALKSAEAVKNRDRTRCKEYTAFWILTQFTEVLVAVPVAGSMISLFRPVLSPIFMLLGEQILGFIHRCMGSNGELWMATATIVVIARLFNQDN